MFVQKFSSLMHRAGKNSIVRGGALSLTLKILGMGSSYLLFFFLSRTGGAERVGTFSIGFNYLTLMGQLATIGLPIALLRFGAPLADKGQWGALRDLRNKVYLLQGSSGLFFMIVSLIVGPYLLELMYHQSIPYVFVLMLSIAIPFLGLNLVSADLVRSLGLIQISEVFRSILVPLGTFIAVFIMYTAGINRDELTVYTVLIVVTAICGMAVFEIILRNKREKFGNGSADQEAPSINKLLTTALPMTITSFAMLIMGKVNVLILGYFHSVEVVGQFTIAHKLAMTTSIILNSVNIIIGPKIAAQYWSNSYKMVNSTLRIGVRLAFLGGLPLILCFVFLPGNILSVFGKEFAGASNILIILAFGELINVVTGSVGLYLNMTGRQRLYMRFTLISLFLSLLLSVWLVPKYGAIASALSLVIAITVLNIAATVFVRFKYNVICYLH